MQTPNQLLKKIIHHLEEIKAIDIQSIDVHEHTSVTDFMIICSGRSSRHVKAIADDVIDKMKMEGVRPLSENGIESGDWALVDFGDVILHVFQPETRAFYNIEGLWQDPKAQ